MNRSNKDRVIRITFNFLPQFRDAVIHGAVTGQLSLRPKGIEKPLAGNDNPGPAHEKFQHFELPKSDLNRLPGATEFHFAEIQRHLAELLHLTDAAEL